MKYIFFTFEFERDPYYKIRKKKVQKSGKEKGSIHPGPG